MAKRSAKTSLRRAVSVLLSFLAYLLPIFVPHGGWQSLGSILLGAFSRATSDPGFFLFFLIAAILLQILLAGLISFFLKRISWSRTLFLCLALPLLLFGLHLAFYFGLPYLLLYEAERRPEQGELTSACTIADASIAPYRSGVSLAMEKARETMILQGENQERARLTMPGCRTQSLETPRRSSTYDWVAPGGFLLFQDLEGVAYYKSPEEAAYSLTPPSDLSYWKPALSDDGRALFWIARDSGQADKPQSLFRRSPDKASASATRLDSLLPLGLALMGADGAEGPFTLASPDDRVFTVDDNGNILSAITDLGNLNLLGDGFRRLDDGFVAWDVYREGDRYSLIWARQGRRGNWELPKGHRIEQLAVQPRGDLIAVAVSAAISFNLVRPAIVILSTNSGEEVYRRNRPKHSNGALAFLGDDHLAISRYEDGKSWVEVFEIGNLR